MHAQQETDGGLNPMALWGLFPVALGTDTGNPLFFSHHC